MVLPTAFKEGTLILTTRAYIPIETLKCGDRVRTLFNDFVTVHSIAVQEIHHTLQNEKEDKLYVCRNEAYSRDSLKHDLVVTGGQPLLVTQASMEGFLCFTPESQTTLRLPSVIDNHYRLPVCADPRAKTYPVEGIYRVFLVALESEDPDKTYGFYVNGGFPVESCSQRYLQEWSK